MSLIRYVFLRNKKSSRFYVTILLLFFVFSCIPFSLSSIEMTRLSIEDTISKYGRGSYDILVRPDTSRTEIEKQYGLVEENYLTGGSGGISIEQYKKIRSFDGIDTAAPVAILGFFTNVTGGMTVHLPT